MNAIVNKHLDGKISYITNSTECLNNDAVSVLQKMFESELREKIPSIDKVYFVQGKDKEKHTNSNYMMDMLNYRCAGLHCLTLEEPNFKLWG